MFAPLLFQYGVETVKLGHYRFWVTKIIYTLVSQWLTCIPGVPQKPFLRFIIQGHKKCVKLLGVLCVKWRPAFVMIFREKSLPRIQGYEVTIDLDNMTIKFQKPSGGDVASVGLLRRLSTVPYVPATCPCEERDANSYVPSHWSPMPPNAQYTRVILDTSSAEFKDVEQLFRKTMNDRAVIKSIERVQNPLLWERYCR